jgi:hypothetical protein
MWLTPLNEDKRKVLILGTDQDLSLKGFLDTFFD